MCAVTTTLVQYGLEKYSRLVRFSQYMIVIALLMDVMIIAAISLANDFV